MLKAALASALLLAFPLSGPPRVQPSWPHYDLHVDVRPDAHRLDVTGELALAAAGETREAIALTMASTMRDFAVDVVAPAVSTGPARVEATPGDDNETRWIVRPRTAFPAGAPIRLRFSYGGGEAGGVGFYVGPEVTLASQLTTWYPLVEGGDRRGVGDLTLIVPRGRVAVADELDGGQTAADDARSTFRFHIANPTYFVFAEGPFTVVRRDGPVPVSAYLLSPAAGMEERLDVYANVLDAIGDEFGPYPFRTLAMVEIPRDILRRSGTDGTAFLGGLVLNSNALRAPDLSLSLPYVAHEIGHQWFPFALRISSEDGRYMAESLAQYASLRAVERVMGPGTAEQYRRYGFPDWGDGAFSAKGYFDAAAAGLDAPLAGLPSAPDGQRIMYVKGMWAWDMLANELGRARFQAVMRGVTREHAFQELSWRDFWREIEHRAHRDLGWFRSQWFEQTGAPDWSLSWRQSGGQMRAVITQRAPYFRATVPIEAVSADGRRAARRVAIAGPRTEVVWRLPFTAAQLDLDPHYETLHWTKEYRAMAEAMVPYTQAQRRQLRGEAVDMAAVIDATLAQAPANDLYGVRFMLHYRRGQMLLDQGDLDGASRQFDLALANSSRCALNMPWLHFFQAVIALQRGDRAAFQSAVASAAETDRIVEGGSGAGGLARSLPPPA